jgi:hypothetical protein
MDVNGVFEPSYNYSYIMLYLYLYDITSINEIFV